MGSRIPLPKGNHRNSVSGGPPCSPYCGCGWGGPPSSPPSPGGQGPCVPRLGQGGVPVGNVSLPGCGPPSGPAGPAGPAGAAGAAGASSAGAGSWGRNWSDLGDSEKAEAFCLVLCLVFFSFRRNLKLQNNCIESPCGTFLTVHRTFRFVCWFHPERFQGNAPGIGILKLPPRKKKTPSLSSPAFENFTRSGLRQRL